MEQDIKYPYIVFKIAGSLYGVNSKYVSTIVQLPHYDKVPAAPANVRGMFRHRDDVIQMLDLRITFGLPSLTSESEAFERMIDARKQDHVVWVNALEQSIETGEPFRLATDPHQCALGKWYDNFETDNASVLFQLHKIDEPHKALHEAAHTVKQCAKGGDDYTKSECLTKILDRVKNESMPTILKLLDETKATFRSAIFREMVLLMDGMKWGIVVDEIVAVEDLNILDKRAAGAVAEQCSYIGNVLENPKHDNLIFELNVESLEKELKEIEKTL